MDTSTTAERTSAEKVTLFQSFFSGLPDAYGTYDPSSGRAGQVKAKVTERVFLAHLTGRRPYGVYLLVKDRTRAIAVDFDSTDERPPAEFVARANHYGIPAHIERSKSKGFHAWIFFEEQGVLARKARVVVSHILEEIEKPDTEIFPKQDVLQSHLPYGNYINAPLFGPLVLKGRTIFIDPATFAPYPNQWDFLDSVRRVGESELDPIIEVNDLCPPVANEPPVPSLENDYRGPASLPPCAVKMLQNGVSQYQRVSCYRLAVQLKRTGLPIDVAVASLKTWALKNRPKSGKDVIRESEIISQAQYAYMYPYTGYGCDSEALRPFCEPSCRVRQWREETRNNCCRDDAR